MEKFKNLSKRMFEPEEDELEMQECTACGFSEDVESPDEMEECPECGEEFIITLGTRSFLVTGVVGL